MIETRYPGVFLTEVAFDAKPIEGVSTSTSDFAAMTALERFVHTTNENPVESRDAARAAARTLGSGSELKYIAQQRYLDYVNESISQAIQFAAFEPNGEQLWGHARDAVSDFLFNEWQSGRLQGARPEEAYFVKCDRSTMTQNDLDHGRLVMLIGVATVKPGEFVILRISVQTATGSN